MPAASDYRSKQADLMREKRDSARIVVVPCLSPEKRKKREELETDDAAWLLFFFSDLFWYEWQPQQLEMIHAIRRAIETGGDQAIAASRGEGKTKIAERLLLKHTLQGTIKLSVLFAATGSNAEDSLDSIKSEVEENELLAEYYPEVCAPVAALENTPNRAHYQKVSGDRHDNGKPFEAANSKFSWCGKEIVFPKIPGSPSSGAIIATRGLDAAVRGLNKSKRRVDVAIIDDPDTEDSARSEEQAKKLEIRIDRAIGGLGGQQRGVGRVIITTLQSRIAVSFVFTDPTQKPSMKGRRFSFMIQRPERMDLWEEYIRLRKEDWDNERKSLPANRCTEYYAANREIMDAGAEVANKYRYGERQLSAIQFYFDEWARKNEEYCLTELDNNPPEDTGTVLSGITAKLICSRLSGYPQGIIPPGCIVLTHSCDLGKTKGYHWVVRGWRQDGTRYVVDYGKMDVDGTIYGSNEGIETAIYKAVLKREEEFRTANYCFVGGEMLRNSISIYDSRAWPDSVFKAVLFAGGGKLDKGHEVWATQGVGESDGAVKAKFRDVVKDTDTRKRINSCTGMYRQLHVGDFGKIWVCHSDTNRWKTFEHDGWLTGDDKPGASYLFGGDRPEGMGDEEFEEKRAVEQREHMKYGSHICAEIEADVEVRGYKIRKWIKNGQVPNDWLDASYMSDVAAAMKGVRVVGTQTVRKTRPPLEQQPGRIREMRMRQR